ncbi:SRPBCC family protein [Streptomyces acidicola]|uniref:SRPBCC family protein n=1 Tax=Streptomyces acidicola TaxID=2596892 RepID=UPI0037A64A7B
MVLFLLERVTPLPVDQAWRRLTHWERHADVVPLTDVRVLTPPPNREGTVFVAHSGLGPLAFDDPMEVVTWQPPTGATATALCRLAKRGRFVTGWAEIEVRPHGDGGSRVLWREDLSVRPLPRLLDRPLKAVARWMFGRTVDGLLRQEPTH